MINYSIVMRSVNANLLEINQAKSRMTLTKWMDDFVKYNAELSESSMKTKRNTHARIDQYLLYIGKPEFLLKDVDKEFCKGFITFLKTCTYNDGNNDSHAFDLCAIGT